VRKWARQAAPPARLCELPGGESIDIRLPERVGHAIQHAERLSSFHPPKGRWKPGLSARDTFRPARLLTAQAKPPAKVDVPESTMLDMMGEVNVAILRRYTKFRAKARREATIALESRVSSGVLQEVPRVSASEGPLLP
jgi:hypothetical protein